MRVRDWLTVKEYAMRRGLKKPTVNKQIQQNRLPDPWDQVEGDSGLILIYYPANAEAQKGAQKSKAKSQANLPGATCDLAANR